MSKRIYVKSLLGGRYGINPIERGHLESTGSISYDSLMGLIEGLRRFDARRFYTELDPRSNKIEIKKMSEALKRAGFNRLEKITIGKEVLWEKPSNN